ncbi:MAG: beta-glucosidase [Opitutaceae bacterium]|nr:beta-glucosidase [Opitutaceae bacterium]
MSRIKPRPLAFPKNFIWGFSAAAPQIEGAAFADGKGPSVWDTFSRRSGAVHNGDNLDVACDHYHLYKKDFALMAKLGARHYRLSIAWPRIFPEGTGAVNRKGLDFYKRLLDVMQRRGIAPWVTMFHWDLPQALENRGGWRVRATADAFATYADTIVKAFGDRVKNWITLNEIICFTRHAYGTGQKAPGAKEGEAVVNQTHHTALLAHGHGVRAVREHGGRDARVGLADNPGVPIPVTETERDIIAARTAFINANIRVIDPIYRGYYSAAYRRITGKDAAVCRKKDFDLISMPADFLGQNIYSGYFVRAGKDGRPETLPLPPSYPRTDAPWGAHVPQSIYWGPRHAAEAYGVKCIYITENGAGYNDRPPANGEMHDLHRRDFVRNYLKEVRRGIGDGVPVKGYFLWSFMDNFEWQDGYARRFGVVYCDFKTQKRTPKTSALWYGRVMKENRLV